MAGLLYNAGDKLLAALGQSHALGSPQVYRQWQQLLPSAPLANGEKSVMTAQFWRLNLAKQAF